MFPISGLYCSVLGCFDRNIYDGGRCRDHFLAVQRERARKRRKNRSADRKNQDCSVKREARLRRRLEDPSIRERDIAKKRRARFEAGIAKWCTRSYLKRAKEEDARTATALRKWLKSFRTPPTREEKLEYARIKTREAYWKDPEKERTRIQAFKHSKPDYRVRWNAERGAREAACSDGTLTQQAVGKLLAASQCCPYCGDPYKKSRRSLDHIIPLAKADGRKLHSLTNVLVCCRSCNCKKRTKGLTQFLEELKAAKRKDVDKSHPDTVTGLFECRNA